MTLEGDRLDLRRHEDEIAARQSFKDWPFPQPRYLGRDVTWQDWLALPPAS